MPLLLRPDCSEGMRGIRRHDVEIDVRPKCRGVWPDRGEPEKLPEAAAGTGSDVPPPGPQPVPSVPPRKRPESSGPPDPGPGRYPQRKKKSFLREIFDFDDIFD